MSLYALDGITADYGGPPVLSGIGLSIEAGEFLAVIGPNGAGKSTLLKILAGNLAARAGTALLHGRPLSRYAPEERAREVSVVHQSLENVLPFTVRDFVAMGRFPHQGILRTESARDRKIIEECIATAGISHLVSRQLTELSGGERQLVYIARALAQSDRVILLDEPVSHLDISHSVQIMDMLHELNRRGATVIAVLHDINLASDYCGRIVALKNGSLFADGSPEEIITYERIESLFEMVCVVFKNPMTGKPYTFPVPRHVMGQNKSIPPE